MAEKTRNKLNEKGWFDEYLKDDIFVEIIKRINTESFEQVDWEYITDYEKFKEKVKRYDQVIFDDGREEGREVGREEGIEIGEYRKTIETAIKGIKAGYPNEIIQTMTGLTNDQIDELRRKYSTN